MAFVFPDYRGGSLVNLMTSVLRASDMKRGRERSAYPELRLLKARELAHAKTVLLVVIDGLGYEWLTKHAKGSFLHKHTRGSITSVFPSSTAAAMTSIYTGVGPQQHAFTGWFMYFKELGMVMAPLAGATRSGKLGVKVDYKELVMAPSIAARMNKRPTAVLPRDFIGSGFNDHATRGVDVRYFRGVDHFFRLTKKAAAKPGLVLAYWPFFDHDCHRYGTRHRDVAAHFRYLDRKLEALADGLAANTTMIVTADHGLVDTDARHAINLRSHPKLSQMLSLPLTGESRASYCSVHAGKSEEFERYVKKNLRNVCELRRSEEMVEKGLFGLGKPSPQLLQRVGDYILLMKGDYLLVDDLLLDTRHDFPAVHGGLRKEEMLVPLIVLQRSPTHTPISQR
jgi:hypothetical protein